MLEDTAKIVIVEDDPTIRTLLEMALMGAGYRHVASSARGDEGLEEIRRTHPDLALLDLMLPGLDGYAVCRRIRETPALADVKIVMLTARTQSEDIVRGLESGADDYVTKPFDRRVLLARVKAVLRRGAPVTEGISLDGLVIDTVNLRVELNGEPIRLTSGEFALLERLVAHRGRILPRPSDDRTVDVQIANLRKKLGSWAAHVETIRGIGYRVEVGAD